MCWNLLAFPTHITDVSMIGYNSYKLYVKKLLMLPRTAREQYYARCLDSLNYDVKRMEGYKQSDG